MELNMKCDKDILLDAVNVALKAVSTKSTAEILGCILLTADDKGLKLLSNDLQMGIETSYINADIEMAGSVAVDAKLFSEFLKSMPEGKISIQCKSSANKKKNTDSLKYDYIVNISSGKTKFKLMGADERFFPKLDVFDINSQLKISSRTIKNMIRKTIFSTSTDESRPVYMGELFDIKDGRLNIVSADSFRLSLIKEYVETEENDSFVIPSRTLNELIKILPESDEIIVLSLSDKNIMFTCEDFKMTSRLIEGNFINYENTIPKDYNVKVKVNRNDMIRSLERGSIISKDDGKTPVKTIIREDFIEITSVSEKSDFYEEVNIEKSGDELIIAFNPKYVLDALRAIEEENVNILLNGTLSPFVITGEEKDDPKYMILPTKIN